MDGNSFFPGYRWFLPTHNSAVSSELHSGLGGDFRVQIRKGPDGKGRLVATGSDFPASRPHKFSEGRNGTRGLIML